MFRFLPFLAKTKTPFVPVKEKKPAKNYHLYLLPDNSEDSLKKAQEMVNGGNAVLLYPDLLEDKGGLKSPYKACFIRNGILRTHLASRKLEEVSIGNCEIDVPKTLPCDITQSQRNGANLIKAALAKANIQLEPELYQIPKALIQKEILPATDTSSLVTFAKTSVYSKKLAGPELAQRQLEKLFAHILNGDMKQVNKILSANPRLTLVRWNNNNKKTIKNKPGQVIYVQGKTAFELALGEEDTQMAAKIKEAILKVSDEKEASLLYYKQFDEKEEWKKTETEKWAPAFAALKQLANAIKDTKPDDITSSGHPEYKITVRKSEILEALALYQSSLSTILNQAVITGSHFNSGFLMQAFKLYDDYYNDFGNDWEDPRAVLFWQRAIGYAQHQLSPANWGQAACDGFYNTEQKLRSGAEQGRSFKYKLYNWQTGHYTDAPGDFYSRAAGENFVICWGPGGGAGVAGRGAAALVSKLMSIKNSMRTELIQLRQHDHRPEGLRSSCLVM